MAQLFRCAAVANCLLGLAVNWLADSKLIICLRTGARYKPAVPIGERLVFAPLVLSPELSIGRSSD